MEMSGGFSPRYLPRPVRKERWNSRRSLIQTLLFPVSTCLWLIGVISQSCLAFFHRHRLAEVNEYIDQLELGHRRKMDWYLEQIGPLRAECEEKTREMAGLGAVVTRYQEKAPWLPRAMEDASSMAVRMVKRAEDAIPEMEARAEATLAGYRRTLAALRTECLNAREELERLTSSVRSSLSSVERQELVHSGKVAGRILPMQEKTNALVSAGADGLLRVGVVGPRLQITTQGGVQVGTVARYVIEQATGTLVGYEIGSTLMEQVPVGSIIPSSAILALTADGLLVSSNIAMQLVGTSLVSGEVAVAPVASNAYRVPQVMGNSPEQRQLRYMVGKLAGRDLIDQDGTVIVAKGATINEDVVARARDAGLLPQLIVNMVLPRPSGGEVAKGS